MTEKMATLGLLKIKVIWNKGYDVINSDHDDTNKILSRDSNYIVDAVMWPKFGTSSVSAREFIITSQPQFYKDLTRKTISLRGVIGLGSVLALGMALKFYTIVAKGLKLTVKKILGTNSYVCRSYRGKTGRGTFLPLILIE